MAARDYEIIVIGAGPGGLTAAILAAKARKRVLIVEKETWGGDCANFGCVPSKSLIASAHVADAVTNAAKWGIKVAGPSISAEGALERVKRIVGHVRATHEPAALAAVGVGTLEGTVEFADPHTLLIRQAEGQVRQLTADQIVIASGSYPVVPPIEGLEQIPYLTNETIFGLSSIPSHLLILGGGPIGCELAQAFCRLGAKVTLVQRNHHLLVKEELQAQELLLQILRREGVHVSLSSEALRASLEGREIVLAIRCKASNGEETLRGSHLMIAVGRLPALAALKLDNAGVAHTAKGITIDRYGRTTTRHIWALGDAVGGQYFTHLAENHARAIVRSLTSAMRHPLDLRQPVPRCTFTDPEVACAGLLARDAETVYGARRIAIHHLPLDKVERAVTDDRTEGFIKVITEKRSGKILGFTIVAPRAAEMLGELALAMNCKIPLQRLRPIIHPFPTYGLGLRQVADI
jgi:pyruvate/2-oxoglutarate dehydrogenase complex dihydrolipoamide dehydrogenase (E3) component